MCAYLENSVDVQSIYTTMELKKKKNTISICILLIVECCIYLYLFLISNFYCIFSLHYNLLN